MATNVRDTTPPGWSDGVTLTNNQDAWMRRALKLEASLQEIINLQDCSFDSGEKLFIRSLYISRKALGQTE